MLGGATVGEWAVTLVILYYPSVAPLSGSMMKRVILYYPPVELFCLAFIIIIIIETSIHPSSDQLG